MFVRLTVETILLGHLAQESDDRDRTILICLWQVDFVTEDNQPLSSRSWRHQQTVVSFLNVTVVIESLGYELCRCRRRKVDEDHLHICQLLESGHQGHRLA